MAWLGLGRTVQLFTRVQDLLLGSLHDVKRILP